MGPNWRIMLAPTLSCNIAITIHRFDSDLCDSVNNNEKLNEKLKEKSSSICLICGE